MRRHAPFRLLLFADPRSATSTVLLGAALRARRRTGVEVVGIVDAANRPTRRTQLPRALLARLARRVSEPRGRFLDLNRQPLLVTVGALARRHRVSVVTPPARDVNDPAFVQRVGRELRPDGALALVVAQIFEPPLLAACGAPANYHNGLLPAYRGVAATAWSVYHGAPRSGFSYHRMSERVDQGPVLVQGAVDVQPDATVATVEEAKTRVAARSMDAALDLLVEGHPGAPQEGESSTFTRADMTAVRDVGDPSRLTWNELLRRLRAFELIDLELDGRRWEVSTLRRAVGRPRHPALAFTTLDGVRAEPSRFVHLPLALYRAYGPLRRRRRAARPEAGGRSGGGRGLRTRR